MTREHDCPPGGAPHPLQQSDHERAKRELTGESDPDLQEANFTFSDDLRIGPETEDPTAAGRRP